MWFFGFVLLIISLFLIVMNMKQLFYYNRFSFNTVMVKQRKHQAVLLTVVGIVLLLVAIFVLF